MKKNILFTVLFIALLLSFSSCNLFFESVTDFLNEERYRGLNSGINKFNTSEIYFVIDGEHERLKSRPCISDALSEDGPKFSYNLNKNEDYRIELEVFRKPGSTLSSVAHFSDIDVENLTPEYVRGLYGEADKFVLNLGSELLDYLYEQFTEEHSNAFLNFYLIDENKKQCDVFKLHLYIKDGEVHNPQVKFVEDLDDSISIDPDFDYVQDGLSVSFAENSENKVIDVECLVHHDQLDEKDFRFVFVIPVTNVMPGTEIGYGIAAELDNDAFLYEPAETETSNPSMNDNGMEIVAILPFGVSEYKWTLKARISEIKNDSDEYYSDEIIFRISITII